MPIGEAPVSFKRLQMLGLQAVSDFLSGEQGQTEKPSSLRVKRGGCCSGRLIGGWEAADNLEASL